jgi:hypothetical protein
MEKKRSGMERLTVDKKYVSALDGEYTEFDKGIYFKLVGSLKKYGQIRPINVIADEENNLFCFEGRKILYAIKSNDLDIQQVEVNIWSLSTDSMLGLQLIINDLKFETNDIKLSEVLNQISKPDSGKLPYTKELLEDYLKLTNFDWLEYERSEETQLGLFE